MRRACWQPGQRATAARGAAGGFSNWAMKRGRRQRDVSGQNQHARDHVRAHQENQQHAHLIVEQQRRKRPRQNSADHHGEGAEHRRAGGAQRGRDRLFDRRAAHHFIADARDRVDAVVDA